MAIDVERELVRYFEWVESRAGSCLHRDPVAAGHAAQASGGGGVDEIRSLEWRPLQPEAEPPHGRRSLVTVAAMVAAVCLPVGVFLAVLVRADTTPTDDPLVKPAPTAIGIVPSTTTGVTAPTTPPPTSPTSVPVTVGAELFSVPASSLSVGSQYESMWGASDGVSFTADGSSVMALTGNAIARIDATTGVPGTPILNPPGQASAATRISRDGTYVYIGSDLVDTVTGVRIELAGTRSDVRGEFSPTGDRIVMPITSRNGQGRAAVFDTATGEVIRELTTDDVAITWATWSPDGSKLMTQGAVGVTRIWDATTGDQLLELTDADSASSFSPDGTEVVTVGPSGRVRVRDASTGEQLALDEHLPAGSHPRAWFSPDGDTVVVTQTDPADTSREIMTLWNVSDGTLAGTIPVGAGNEFPPGAFGGDHVVVLTPDGPAEIWSTAGSTKLATITPVSEAFISVGFSPDGKRLVALESDRTVRVWEIA